MAQSKHQIQELLSRAGSGPRKQFGQNFMIDQNLVRLVAEAGEIAAGDVVIEVGPGTGTLTEELLARAGKVIAVEIDRDLAAMLREKFSGDAKFQLIEGDALAGKHAVNAELLAASRLLPSPLVGEGKGEGEPREESGVESPEASGGRSRNAPCDSDASPSPQPSPSKGEGGKARAGSRVKLVANLPYNIASPLIIELLIAGIDLLAFTVQKEVADRLRAPAGSEAYGPLSVMAQMLSDVEVLRTLPPQAFWPPPKIDSALVRMRRRVHPDLLTVGQTFLSASDRRNRRDESDSDVRIPTSEADKNVCPTDMKNIHEFGKFVAKLFSFRRKTIRKALSQAGYQDVERILSAQGIDPRDRPEVLTPEQILKLFEATRSRTEEAGPPPAG